MTGIEQIGANIISLNSTGRLSRTTEVEQTPPGVTASHENFFWWVSLNLAVGRSELFKQTPTFEHAVMWVESLKSMGRGEFGWFMSFSLLYSVNDRFV